MTMKLTAEQKNSFRIFLEEFKKTEITENEGEIIPYREFDKKRADAEKVFRVTIDQFLSGRITIDEFKQASSEFCFKYPYWGFKAFSGQMQLNQYVNNIADAKREKILRDSLALPKSNDEAKTKINSMAQYLGELKVSSGNAKSIPRVNQTYLLTYFWSLQDREKWPIFYGSYKKQFSDINFSIEVAETPGEEYIAFVDFFEALRSYVIEELGIRDEVPYWFIEHVFWIQFLKKKSPQTEELERHIERPRVDIEGGSWIPPIIADLPQLALNQESVWSKANKIAAERAFEIKLQYVFQILGYQVIGLGQGTGREPDGVAISIHSHEHPAYAIIFDGKAREKCYSIGTEDRAIVEYIRNKQKELIKQHIDKLSFLIVSSEISDSSSTKGLAMRIYLQTRVPVILVRADDLLRVVEEKLKNCDIDHGQLEELFIETGLLTREKIAEILGAR
ncbi:MAG: hypothetical protein V1738_00345 [Patescibacteria group bacterium]